MSVLVILIPPRVRLGARATDAAAAPPAPAEGYSYALSSDGLAQTSQGQAQAALLPRADSVVAVLAEGDVSWQRITLPKAPASRLRAALGGLLEENLLDDDDALHLALEPGAVVGQPTWVAVVHKAWLRAELEQLEKAGLSIERVLPASWPGDAPQGHFFDTGTAVAGNARIMLSHADENGHQLLRLEGSLGRALLPPMIEQPTRWTATPPVAAPAERWLGASVTVLDRRRTRAAGRAFAVESAPVRPGAAPPWHACLAHMGRRFLSPAWRPVRLGLVRLVLLQVAGSERCGPGTSARPSSRSSAAQDSLLRASFPDVRAVLDAPLQMSRETDVLRAAAGRTGDGDLETLLGAAAAAWPEGQGPVHTLRFEPGRLTLSATGWNEQQLAQFRDRLRPGGWTVDSAEGRVTLSRGEAGSRS